MTRRLRRTRGVMPIMLIETVKPMPQVVVRVVPRLLGDVLSIVLRDRRFEVSTCPTGERRARPRAPRRFDLAIVTDGLPDDVSAEQVIVIDENGTPAHPGAQRMVSASGDDGDLSALLALIDDLLY
jgi:hypothetical protein